MGYAMKVLWDLGASEVKFLLKLALAVETKKAIIKIPTEKQEEK